MVFFLFALIYKGFRTPKNTLHFRTFFKKETFIHCKFSRFRVVLNFCPAAYFHPPILIMVRFIVFCRRLSYTLIRTALIRSLVENIQIKHLL